MLVFRIRGQGCNNRQGIMPPRLHLLHKGLVAFDYSWVAGDKPGNRAFVTDVFGKIKIAVIPAIRRSCAFPHCKAILPQARIVAPEMFQGIDLNNGHPAMQMGSHIMGLGRRRIIDIAADIAVVVFRGYLRHRHPAGIGGNIRPPAGAMDNLIDVFRPQMILGLAFAVFPVRIDKQHMVALGGALFIHDQKTGGNAGAVKKVAGQADNGLQIASFNKMFTRCPLLTPTE